MKSRGLTIGYFQCLNSVRFNRLNVGRGSETFLLGVSTGQLGRALG
jgi:hypothetical protein